MREAPSNSLSWEFDSADHTILVWRRGTAKHKETYSANRCHRLDLRQSSVWVIPAESHSFASARDTSAVEFHQLSLDPSLVGSGELRSVISQRDPVLHGLLDRIASTSGRSDTVAGLLRDSLFDATRLHVLDAYGVRREPRRIGRRSFDRGTRQKLTEFLHDGLDREITLEAMAEISGMSVRSFRQSFSAEYGTTPHQYLLDVRIGRAKDLLTTTALSVAEIGALVGFGRPSHFAATFKSRVGVSPTQFRVQQG
ncbi:helix-turn-helix transcriptional regulator [Gordonia phthalatica]|uniref:helix-turn-helix transcriptional regulator n=1 Tax=Gordonia phthalatica TaxID=1136941 RepID=UPI0012FEECC0|nr:helix-turn-helix transcriptional regulator [Gordonia phthalatica]